MRFIFTITLFLSSALLFLVQPMVAKMVLPPFGGTPMVWSGSMLFFQAVLLLGYGYAHLSTKWLGPKRQVWVHLALLCVAILTLPIAIPAGFGALGGGSPLPPLLAALTIGVGLVFFGLSAGAPVIQRWFAQTSDPQAKDPYFLYAASNVGSMLALLAYPTLIEPRLALHAQADLWRWLYFGLVACMFGTGILTLRAQKSAVASASDSSSSGVVAGEEDVPITWAQRRRWILYALIPSSLMLGLTTYFTTNIAPVPLLWVVPLAIYLLTFIIAFARKRWLKTQWVGRALPLLVVPLVLAMVIEPEEPLWLIATLHLVTFFCAALLCHMRMVDERPSVKHLTEFYLWMSVGGVLGGIFNTIVAPLIFNSISEYPLMVALACLIRPWPKPEMKWNKVDLVYPFVLAALTGALIYFWPQMDQRIFTGLLYDIKGRSSDLMDPRMVRNLIALGIPVIIAFLAVDRPIRFGLSVGAVMLMMAQMRFNAPSEVLMASRNFFGVHKVVRSEMGSGYNRLVHGNTTHGQQSLNPARRRTPLTYYWTGSGVGQVMSTFVGDKKKKQVGLIGLGIGTLAAYGQRGQTMHFHEIDPQIVKIAEDKSLFTYLSDSLAEIKITLGDARLTMAKEPDGLYGIIVVDAFSSDAIPVHLITKEAVQLLLRKLEPGGVLLYHISNRYLDLEPVLGNIGKALKVPTVTQMVACSTEELFLGYSHTSYVMMAKEKETLKPFEQKYLWVPSETRQSIGVWTDDYSNVLSVMKRQ